MKINVKNEIKKAVEKKYSGVYAMGDAPIAVRGMVKFLERLDLDGLIEGVNPRNGGERLAVVLALAIKEFTGGGVDLRTESQVMRTIDGTRVPTLEGRGGAHWEDITINDMLANYLANTADNAETKKSKKK